MLNRSVPPPLTISVPPATIVVGPARPPERTSNPAMCCGWPSWTVEGQNLAIEVRWANNDHDRLPDLAADLVHHRVRVIVAFGTKAGGGSRNFEKQPHAKYADRTTTDPLTPTPAT
jgi:hypothetical protein